MKTGRASRWLGYPAVVVLVGATIGILKLFPGLADSSVALLLLLAVFLAAWIWESAPDVLAAVLATLGFNFFFLPPLYTFTIEDPRNVVAEEDGLVRVRKTFHRVWSGVWLLLVPLALPAQEPARFIWGFQATTITQTAPSFRSPYEAERSFRNDGSDRPATTLTTTLYSALLLWKGAWISVQPEFSGGDGVGGGQGLGAQTNIDIVRVPSIAGRPYIARAFLQQVIPLGRRVPPELSQPGMPEGRFLPGGDHAFSLSSGRRLEITAGKISLPDIYDTNDFVADGHHGLMNWAFVNDGAWDYAADTRGYSWGLTIALEGGPVAFRLGTYAMPSVANGPDFDHDFRRAHAENAEVEWIFDREAKGIVRLLAWVNHARMGDYEESIASAAQGIPDVSATRQPGRHKWGLGLNAQRAIGENWGVLLRLGWNDAKTETFAYTEIDRTASVGISPSGELWKRPGDRAFVAFVASELSGLHRRYLEAGGLGFQLGDGRLRYASEQALEIHYNAAITRKASLALDVQRLFHPGFNADRGPIWIYGLRLHLHR